MEKNIYYYIGCIIGCIIAALGAIGCAILFIDGHVFWGVMNALLCLISVPAVYVMARDLILFFIGKDDEDD